MGARGSVVFCGSACRLACSAFDQSGAGLPFHHLPLGVCALPPPPPLHAAASRDPFSECGTSARCDRRLRGPALAMACMCGANLWEGQKPVAQQPCMNVSGRLAFHPAGPYFCVRPSPPMLLRNTEATDVCAYDQHHRYVTPSPIGFCTRRIHSPSLVFAHAAFINSHWLLHMPHSFAALVFAHAAFINSHWLSHMPHSFAALVFAHATFINSYVHAA
eukprot:362897-Chlamydomonas_euryale.AAC.4